MYVLKIEGEEKTKDRSDGYRKFTEIYPKDPWNYGLIQKELDQIPNSVEVVENSWDGQYPWNLTNVPIMLKMKGYRIPEWIADNGTPYFPIFWGTYSGEVAENIQEITLVPYGCSTLRISQFPTINLKAE